jgi:D-inositol-3-phosphate glycosyltransferase
MACGTPVVASQVGGLAFLIQDGVTGYMVPSNEPLALADRLTRLLKDQPLRQEMGRKAAELARNYSWEIIGDKILRLYNHMLAENARSSVH